MQRAFEDAYQAFDEAVQIDPDEAYLWFNYGLACLHTSRTGKSVPALERAVELEGQGEMADRFGEQLDFSRQIAESELATRGPDFSLDRLIKQQELFQQGLQLTAGRKWAKAEEVYREAIAMGDCLPQPWGNLGICLVSK